MKWKRNGNVINKKKIVAMDLNYSVEKNVFVLQERKIINMVTVLNLIILFQLDLWC